MFVKVILILFGLFSLFASFALGNYFHFMRSGDHGFGDKYEYSAIQAYSGRYKNMDNDKPYLIEKIKNNNYALIAFPIKGKQKGYVVIFPNPEGGHKIKSIPNVDFELTQEVYNEIKAKVHISEDVDTFIASHIVRFAERE
jgi:hypothetical protein